MYDRARALYPMKLDVEISRPMGDFQSTFGAKKLSQIIEVSIGASDEKGVIMSSPTLL